MNTLLIVVAVFSGILGCLIAYALYDEMVKWLYQCHRQEWHNIGEPIGMFWVPPHISRFSLRASSARGRTMWTWLFKAPPHLKTDSRMKLCLVWYRISFIMFIGGIVAGALLGMMSGR